MSFAIKSLFSCAAVLGVMATGCAADHADDSDVSSQDVVVGTANIADKVAVFTDRLEFDAEVLPSLQASLAKVGSAEPVYFVGQRASDALDADGSVKDGARNRTGYLRKALSWSKGEGGKLVVMTEPASMADAIEEVKKNGYVAPQANAKGIATSAHPLDVNEANWATGDFNQSLTHTFGNGGDGFIPIDLSGKVLWEKTLFTGGHAQIKLKRGKITIKPQLQADILIQHFIPQHGQAILTTDVAGELEFEASAEGAFEIDRGEDIFEKSWGTVVAGVPLTLGVRVKWECDLGISGSAVASIGATATGSLRAGATYDGSHVAPVLDKPTYTFDRLGPTLSAKVDVNGRCDLMTEVSIALFDAAGPQASVDLYAALNTHADATLTSLNANASLKVGVDAKVGGSLRPFGIKIAEINTPPWNYEKEIFSGAIAIGK